MTIRDQLKAFNLQENHPMYILFKENLSTEKWKLRFIVLCIASKRFAVNSTFKQIRLLAFTQIRTSNIIYKTLLSILLYTCVDWALNLLRMSC